MTLPKPSDPLLSGAKIVIYISYAVLIFFVAILSLGAVVAPTFGKSRVLAEFAKVGVPPEGLWLLSGGLALAAVMIGVGFAFTRSLHSIVNSVGEGDPFHPENASRLSHMGWLAFAGQIIALPLASIEGWFRHFLIKADRHLEIGFGIGLGSILLILVLFILARVFRKGAEMREEMEGTV